MSEKAVESVDGRQESKGLSETGTGSEAGWTEIVVALCNKGCNAFSLSAPEREDVGMGRSKEACQYQRRPQHREEWEVVWRGQREMGQEEPGSHRAS